MDLVAVLESQYLAALKALRATTEQCPDAFWTDTTTGAPFWRATYHTLFVTDMYFNDEINFDYIPWEGHRPEAHLIGPIRWENNRLPKDCEPYTKVQMLGFHELAVKAVKDKLPQIDLSEASPFDWIPSNRLEVMLYNIRHIQHHAGALSQRLRIGADEAVAWVRMGALD